MCGRFSLAVDKETFETTMQREFHLDVEYESFNLPRYNIAPSQDILTLIHDGKKYRLGTLKWGFKPAFIKDPSFNVINARSESVAQKPLFKTSLKSKRCLILADGFYEWLRKDNSKTPMRFTHQQKKLFTMAGIYTESETEEGEPYYSVAILTQEANEDMNSVHDRMPVLLSESERLVWVHPKNNADFSTLSNVLDKKEAGLLKHYPVSSIVNNPKNDTQKCLTPTNRS